MEANLRWLYGTAFDRYQKIKITLSFDNPTQFTHKENGWRVLEDTPYKKVFEVPKKVGECLGALLELAPGGCDDRRGRNRKGGGTDLPGGRELPLLSPGDRILLRKQGGYYGYQI